MKPEQIDQVIAERCGWSDCFNGTGYTKEDRWSKCCPHFVHSDEKRGLWFASIPNFYHDLNACALFEEVLTDRGQLEDYDRHLRWIVQSGPDANYPKITARIFLWHATAPQKCEAFLKAFDLWEESK
jgi:hypothetical protein